MPSKLSKDKASRLLGLSEPSFLLFVLHLRLPPTPPRTPVVQYCYPAGASEALPDLGPFCFPDARWVSVSTLLRSSTCLSHDTQCTDCPFVGLPRALHLRAHHREGSAHFRLLSSRTSTGCWGATGPGRAHACVLVYVGGVVGGWAG
jgi:hypothetical protein